MFRVVAGNFNCAKLVGLALAWAHDVGIPEI
jgi:hypothetical protein